MDPATPDAALPVPRWLLELERLLPIRAQFVLSGNIRDLYVVPIGPSASGTLATLNQALIGRLAPLGYGFLLWWDPVDGVRVWPHDAPQRDAAVKLFELKLGAAAAGMPMGLDSLAQLAQRVAGLRQLRTALVIDFASRMVRSPTALDAAEHRFFVAMEKLALSSHPVTPPPPGAVDTVAPDSAGGPGKLAPAPAPVQPLFNPIVFLANRLQDLPSWFTLDVERVAELVVPAPDYETRMAAAGLLGPLFPGHASLAPSGRAAFARQFTDGTDGLTLAALTDIAQLATLRQLGADRVEDAVRAYKVGVADNPWRKPWLRERIKDAVAAIERRVKGQRPAVVKSVDILTRSVMGLTGAQARGNGARPRGVLFFAGPTGVGKTELAKSLTELVFGDERAYIRFDMSEFAAEHTGARLLGAPPGYVGFDAGGELTNAVRERPFSLILFDEIEKAHPRLLDKFLQILEDGRLTDGRGQTVYFSESIIVFTSNLGITVEDEQGRRTQQVRPGDPFEEVEAKVRAAIGEYFKFRLMRPELLNRIGDNIVVFDFIAPAVAAAIFDGMLANVVRRVQSEHRVGLRFAPAVLERLRALCTDDLSNGGRGIGNRLESVLINPLARALFVQTPAAGSEVTVTAVEEVDRVWTAALR